MGTCAREPVAEVEITQAAVRAYSRVMAVFGPRCRTHGSPDGGLICEYRANPCRPTLWRITPDGTVESDRRYSFARRAFITPATLIPSPRP